MTNGSQGNTDIETRTNSNASTQPTVLDSQGSIASSGTPSPQVPLQRANAVYEPGTAQLITHHGAIQNQADSAGGDTTPCPVRSATI